MTSGNCKKALRKNGRLHTFLHFCAICKNKLKLKAKLSDKE